MIPNLRKVFECLRSSGLKLSAKKCQFVMPSITFLGNTITEKGLQPEEENFFEKHENATDSQANKKIDRICSVLQIILTTSR